MRSTSKYTQEATNDVTGYRQASKPQRIANTVVPLYLGESFSIYEPIIQSATLPVTQKHVQGSAISTQVPRF